MKSGTCEVCGKGFKSSAYWFLRKKTDFPTKCSACRLANRDKMRLAIENGASQEQVASQQVKKVKQANFRQLIGDLDENFPSLPA
jgi:hypothetical protein